MENVNKKELIEYFLTDNQCGYKTREKHIIKKFNGLIDLINDYNQKYFDDELPFTQKLYDYLYEITEIPKCKNCGNLIKWRGVFTEGYLKYCSKKCRNEVMPKIMNEAIVELYGVKNIFQLDKFKNERWNTGNNKIIEHFKLSGFEVIESNKKTLKIKHPDGHIFEGNRKILINRLNRGIEVSTKILPIGSTFSTIELEIRNFINTLNIQHSLSDRKILSGKELDIYFQNNKLAIEFDGLYWHSENFLPNDYHLNKTEQCEKQEIELLHIFEDEWLCKEKIVKSIIKSKLNIFDTTIDGNKCSIKEIDEIECNKFLSNNHIFNSIESDIRIGLFYDDELMLVITFKNNSNNEYEILSNCNKLNTNILNSNNKLIEYFKAKYQPSSITILVDRRYSNGNEYKDLGFNFIKNTEPIYWYFDKNSIIKFSRFKIKPEDESTLDKRFLKIFDCGSIKFELTLKK